MAARRFWTVLLPLVLVVSVWNPAEGDERDPGTPSEVSARAGTTVSAKVSRTGVRVGRKVVVSGKVSGKAKRKVVLQTKVAGSWRTLSTGRTTKARRYRLLLPT